MVFEWMMIAILFSYAKCFNVKAANGKELFRQGTQEQWRIVFFLSAAFYLIGWLGYIIVVKGHVLPWAQSPVTVGDIVKEVSESRNMSM